MFSVDSLIHPYSSCAAVLAMLFLGPLAFQESGFVLGLNLGP